MDEEGKIDEEDELLISIVKTKKEINWDQISLDLKDKNFSKTSKQCRER